MKIEEINLLPIPDRIIELKKRPTPIPDKDTLLADWDADRHDVMSHEKRPKRKIEVEPAQYDDKKEYLENVLGIKTNTDISKQLAGIIGKDITDKGFMSTSSVAGLNVFENYPVKLEIKARKGTKAFFAGNEFESECIFA